MKKLAFLSCTLFAIIYYSCGSNTNSQGHEELIQWLDKGNLSFGPENQKLSDAQIIEILKLFTALDSMGTEKNTFMRLMADKVDLDSAKYYHTFYCNRHDSIVNTFKPTTDTFNMAEDKSEAIIINLERLWPAIRDNFSNELIFPTLHKTIGLVLYQANYGQWGHKLNGIDTNQYQTTHIIQLAKKIDDPEFDWEVIPGEIYNFGDLKPPKKIRDEEITR